MGVPRLADHAPAACSVCFTQHPDQRHVDFDAAWDGPVLPAGDTVIAIDDLIICEGCMTAGGKILGLTDPGELAGRVEALEDQLAAADEAAAERTAYIDQLEKTVAAKPDGPRARAKAASQ